MRDSSGCGSEREEEGRKKDTENSKFEPFSRGHAIA
jgi:hypothetical protein